MKRVILLVIDSVGIGELPDAHLYGDEGSNTLINIKSKRPDMVLENMLRLGLSHIEGASLLRDKEYTPIGAYGKCDEKSQGKDTTTGHWEMAGLITEIGFPTYPNGFPKEIIDEFEIKTGKKTISNKVASGTEIIKELGEEHLKTGGLIVYTSADSVFQIAAHEDIVKVDELYRICEIARDILKGEHAVSRVIARPFIGEVDNFTRTANRRDFSLAPHGKTMLDYISESGKTVAGVGKIHDIFLGQGINKTVDIANNMEGMDKTLDFIKTVKDGIIFTNLVDFDMLYGHRNDVDGYAQALIDFDNRLIEIMESLKKDDILMVTADHGCDPTTKGTDHTREYVPILVYGQNVKENINLGIRDSFADIGKTIMEYLEVEGNIAGESFLNLIIK